MNKNKGSVLVSSILGLAVAIALVVGVVAYNKTSEKAVQGIGGQQGLQGPQGERGLTGVQGPQGKQGPRGYAGASGGGDQIVKAVTGPDSYFPCETHNGIQTCFNKLVLLNQTNGTTTPCSIQSPAATSSLRYTTLQINTSTTTAGLFTLATSTTAFATTTPYQQFTVGANKTYSYVYIASTTPTATMSGVERLFAPSTWLVYGVSGALQIGATNYGHIYPGAVCQAVFDVL